MPRAAHPGAQRAAPAADDARNSELSKIRSTGYVVPVTKKARRGAAGSTSNNGNVNLEGWANKLGMRQLTQGNDVGATNRVPPYGDVMSATTSYRGAARNLYKTMMPLRMLVRGADVTLAHEFFELGLVLGKEWYGSVFVKIRDFWVSR